MERKCQKCLFWQHAVQQREFEEERSGLWMLYKTAYELYQSEVMKGRKLYNRYVSDFLNSHMYTDRVDVAGMNEHKKNFCILEELLTLRKDLVQKYFTKEKLCDTDYLRMHEEFNTTQLSPNSELPIASGSLPVAFTSRPNFQCYFNPIQIRLLMQSVNKAHLFSSDVTEVEVKGLFACCLERPLKSACNRRVAFFFDSLCEHKLISTRWQQVIDKNELILSSAGKNVLLNNSKLSTALNEAKQNDGCAYRAIDLMVLEIAESREYSNPNIG